MINYGVINTLNLVAFFATLAVCVSKGGRYERRFALMVFTAWLIGTLAQKLTHDYVPLAVFLTVDLALLAGLGWTLWRYRPTWMIAAAVVQGLMVTLSLVHFLPLRSSELLFLTIGNTLGHVQSACVLLGVLRRRVGPPFRLASESSQDRTDRRAA